MTYAPATQVAVAKTWVGFREGPNNRNPFSYWQYGDYTEPYCASFTAYCAFMAGFRFPPYCAHGEKGDSWVTGVRLHAIQQGIWRDKSHHARPGWLVVESFTLRDQHIEMSITTEDVTKPPPSSIATIGGNTGNGVFYRVRSKGNVVGYVALDEAGQNVPPIPPPDPATGVPVKNTDRTDAVYTKLGGRYVLGADGGVFAYGDAKAPFYGSLPGKGIHLDLTKEWACSIVLTPDEGGYWILTTSGGIFSFGNAAYHLNFQHDVSPTDYAVKLLPSSSTGYKAIRYDGAFLSPR